MQVGGQVFGDPQESRAREPLERLSAVEMQRFSVGRMDPNIVSRLAALAAKGVGRRTDREQVEPARPEDPERLARNRIDLVVREHHVQSMGIDDVDRSGGGRPEGIEHVAFLEAEGGWVLPPFPTAGNRDGRMVDRSDARHVLREKPGIAAWPGPQVEQKLSPPQPSDPAGGPPREVGGRAEKTVGVPGIVPVGDRTTLGGGDGT